MVSSDCTASHHDGVTLVTVQLRDIDVPTRVHIENRLDGPLWPPRREGIPEPGWTDAGFAGVVGPGDETLGYATPAEPDGQPAELVDAERVPDAGPVGELTADAASVVRQLGDPSPPADAVPSGGTEPTVPPADGPPTVPDDPALEPASGTAVGRAERPDQPDAAGDTARDATADDTFQRPPAVGPWLDEMARRVGHAEALGAVETLPAATEAVRDAGGLAAVRDLSAAADERKLRALSRRTRRLADRRAEATVPVETLAALA